MKCRFRPTWRGAMADSDRYDVGDQLGPWDRRLKDSGGHWWTFRPLTGLWHYGSFKPLAVDELAAAHGPLTREAKQ